MDIHVDQKVRIMIASLDQDSNTLRAVALKLYELEDYEDYAQAIMSLKVGKIFRFAKYVTFR